MRVLGIRFSNKDLTFAVLSGSFASPTLEETGTLKLPKNFSRCKVLMWLHQELTELIVRVSVECIYLKGLEPSANKSSLSATERIEHEAIAHLVAEQNAIAKFDRVVDATAAARLKVGPKNKKDLCYECASEAFGNALKEKELDAILAAWTKMV